MAKNKSITIGETVVAPGKQASISLPVADLYTGTSLSMPVRVINGRRPGPVLFVSAAIHGDELNGVEIIRRLLKRKGLTSLRGTLLAVPVVNVHGFLDQSRYLPDRRDLNRSFPGSVRGSQAGRLVGIECKSSFLVIDHAGDPGVSGALGGDQVGQDFLNAPLAFGRVVSGLFLSGARKAGLQIGV